MLIQECSKKDRGPFHPWSYCTEKIPSSELGCLSNYANNNFITTQLHSVHSWEAYNGFCLFKWAHTMMRRECLAAKITKIISIRVCALELAWWQLKSRVDPVMPLARVRSLGCGTVIHWWAIHEQSHKSRLVKLNGGSLLSPHIRSQFKFDTFSSKYLQHVLVPAFVFVFSRVIGISIYGRMYHERVLRPMTIWWMAEINFHKQEFITVQTEATPRSSDDARPNRLRCRRRFIHTWMGDENHIQNQFADDCEAIWKNEEFECFLGSVKIFCPGDIFDYNWFSSIPKRNFLKPTVFFSLFLIAVN